MSKPLMTLFQEAEAAQIDWGGQQLFALVETPAQSDFELVFVRAKECPVQGINLKCMNGTLAIEGVEATEMVLWNDTAPEKIQVQVKPKSTDVPRLKIWNVWRGKVGGVDVKQAWLGNAGMRIEQVSEQTRICCSDGMGEVDFSDLVVDLRFL
ncbi:hypothetical protein [Novosphingobium percolationis]|uniref:hypothetical protein n=1 Tax=Novosphingobium percolationis TaxID=2871811 RepID=UPI001CD33354|nr:hypothetical protein [Novosphingobium percolationis]